MIVLAGNLQRNDAEKRNPEHHEQHTKLHHGIECIGCVEQCQDNVIRSHLAGPSSPQYTSAPKVRPAAFIRHQQRHCALDSAHDRI